jgi:hypothetical protein
MTSTLLAQILRTQNPHVSARECVSTPYLPRTPVGVGVGAATAGQNSRESVSRNCGKKSNLKNLSPPPRPLRAPFEVTRPRNVVGFPSFPALA